LFVSKKRWKRKSEREGRKREQVSKDGERMAIDESQTTTNEQTLTKQINK